MSLKKNPFTYLLEYSFEIKNKVYLASAYSIFNKLFVLKSGELIAEGNHSNLINESDFYKKLWDIQTGSFG